MKKYEKGKREKETASLSLTREFYRLGGSGRLFMSPHVPFPAAFVYSNRVKSQRVVLLHFSGF